MKLVEVTDAQTNKAFIELVTDIYKDDPHYVRPLNKDLDAIFDRKKNKFYRHGDLKRWILTDNNKIIGRIAAFVNNKTAKSFKQPTGGVGFFECIDNKDAAFLLFDKAKEWLAEQGMEAMDGPINFGEKDKFWGLITENFDAPPYYNQNYNPQYYVALFEAYGFKNYYNQFIYRRLVHDPLQDKYVERAKRIADNPKYTFKHVDKNNIEKGAEDFRTVYNRAWIKHGGFKAMPKAQALNIFKTLKPVIDEKLIWYVYYEGVPVGFYLSLPELNQIFKEFNGKFGVWEKIRFKYYQLTGKITTSFGVAFGIDPDHQGKGLEGALLNQLSMSYIHKSKYHDVIVTWIGEFNPKMIQVIENLGCTLYRTMATYRKLFDENTEFERAKKIV
jgi:GNAT superfamily N-acetyltransferase